MCVGSEGPWGVPSTASESEGPAVSQTRHGVLQINTQSTYATSKEDVTRAGAVQEEAETSASL